MRHLWLLFVTGMGVAQPPPQSATACEITQALVDEIRSFQPAVDRIIAAVRNGSHSGKFYNDLVDFVDTFGPRPAGSIELEAAIDNVIERQKAAGLHVSTHSVDIPHWVRGEESAEMLTPRRQKLNILGLGGAGNTTAEGITAQVIVVSSFEELDARKDEIPGKIVLFNAIYTAYNKVSKYRTQGPHRASILGAVGALVRSITPFSLSTPHTGITIFPSQSKPIPAAAVTLENANLITRLVTAGKNVTIRLVSSAQYLPRVKSRNVIGDLIGTSKSHEYVVLSGHIDSWDVGQGAIDNGAGAFLAWESLALIKSLADLEPPVRTIRSILWTSEETSYHGVNAYKVDRFEELANWTAVFESDEGVFKSQGISFRGLHKAGCILQEVLKLFSAINATLLNRKNSVGSDIHVFEELGIPAGEPYTVSNDYFWYHHTEADAVEVLNSDDLDQNLAIFASLTYVLSRLSHPLPRELNIPPTTPAPSRSYSNSSAPTFTPFSPLYALLATPLISLLWRRDSVLDEVDNA